MAGNEITVVGSGGVASWLSGATRIGEVYMTNVVTMVTNVLLKVGKDPITRLNVIDHGVGSEGSTEVNAQFGKDEVSAANFGKFEPKFMLLREFFSDNAIIHLQHCELGTNKALIRKFAAAFRKPVYAGTSSHNPIYRIQFGDYVRCSSAGLFTVGVDRP